MRLVLGNKIRELRNNKGWTQENLSERLNVSVQAVSRWENDLTFPDIELLPEIALLFEISVDELLGVNEVLNSDKINSYIEEADSYYHVGDISSMILVLEKAVMENPTNVKLVLKLVSAYSSLYDDDRNVTCKKILELGNKICNRISDINDKCSLYQIMSYTYMEIGDKEKAIEFANKLPKMSVCSSFIMTSLLDGDEKLEFIQYNIQELSNKLVIQIKNLARSDKYLNDEKIKMLDKINNFYALLFENEDYGYENYLLSRVNFEIARLYALEKDSNNAILYLDKAFNYASSFDNIKSILKHTSLINNKTEFDLSINFGKDYKENEVSILRKMLKSNEFLFLRDNKDFKRFCVSG